MSGGDVRTYAVAVAVTVVLPDQPALAATAYPCTPAAAVAAAAAAAAVVLPALQNGPVGTVTAQPRTPATARYRTRRRRTVRRGAVGTWALVRCRKLPVVMGRGCTTYVVVVVLNRTELVVARCAGRDAGNVLALRILEVEGADGAQTPRTPAAAAASARGWVGRAR